MPTAANDFSDVIQEHQQVFSQLSGYSPLITAASKLIISTLISGHKILLCGNGGSAADCQHFAAELVIRYHKNRRAYPAIALTTDTSILTAHPNDFSFDSLFSRQVEALGSEGDCLIAFSTSGNSENIIQASISAKQQNMSVIGLMGGDGGRLKPLVDMPIIVPSTTTARIQEAHMLIYHWWCEMLDEVADD
ncbi:MAG TPA: SIS domain-containing protein [Methyloprofundus sp.]|jgi:D-sedoheptulose 7-phosphate isomerase|uniref:D-sedoheptulose-7-phosphate isomerase n=1 Tax=Methyloprofundus sp. TaxID=2020875 RepID=UPI001848B793|nr:SIS domain-containing protein [Methyloprofundus sp.]MBT3811362.1 SIS domain-containing protein [Gammaproteobacteria bacterium]HIL79342.1 SIS domain-containing protein [Methylococcales bacterium]MBT5222749.1 SIS domain-containing protein [Gammaproteobacteria bacterium]MBT5827134.1 SIS domain-containing protein [Gammaproteobacteria bacterium]MBT6420381.1 SIS domain-containing protein [Gammaproteobacteria bacterium]